MRRALLVILLLLCAGCGGESARDRGGPYDTARDLCSLDSVDKLADEFGGDAANPASVARAYAAKQFSGDASSHAEAGCLEGIRTRR